MTATAYSSNNPGMHGIRRSFEPYRRPSSLATAGNRPICYGDRLFARLVMHGRTVVEFMVNSVNDLSELWGELRRQCRGISGLARLYLRNASRGWSMEKPLMLYPDRHIQKTETSSRSEDISAVFHKGVRQLSLPF